MVLAFFLKVVYLLVYCIYVLSDDIRDAHDHSEEDANANHFGFPVLVAARLSRQTSTMRASRNNDRIMSIRGLL
jgi:hypothetical protein